MSDIPRLDHSDKVVIVTGGGRGVGRGISERFLDAGAEVVICGRSELQNLPEVNGRKAHFTVADVRDVEQVEAVIHFVGLVFLLSFILWITVTREL